MLPKKAGQTPEDRAKDIDKALTWLRNGGVDDATESPVPAPFDKMTSLPIDKRTPEEKARDVEDALNWKRNPKANAGPSTEPFKSIDQLLPDKGGQSPEERANDIDNALTWLRNRGIDEPRFGRDSPFRGVDDSPIPDRRSPSEKAKDVEDITNWVRNPKAHRGPST